MQQRETEAELLAIGLEFRHALQSYADTTPAGQPTEPKELAELLRDARQPGVQRHLRRIYLDPLTGKDDWGLEKSPDGRIAGIHSRSTAVPLRRENFPIGCEQFARAEHYTEWVFAPTPIGVGRATQNR